MSVMLNIHQAAVDDRIAESRMLKAEITKQPIRFLL